MRDTTNSGAYQRWKLLVVEKAEVFARRDHGRESFPSTRTHAGDAKGGRERGRKGGRGKREREEKENEEKGRRAERQRQ